MIIRLVKRGVNDPRGGGSYNPSGGSCSGVAGVTLDPSCLTSPTPTPTP